MDPRRFVLCAVLVGGCLPHTPLPRWSEASKELCQGGMCYRVGELGPSWQAVHREAGSIGFFDAQSGGVIESNAPCRDDAEATPLRNLTGQLLIGYTEREIREERTVQLAERDALYSRVDAKLDGVPITLQLYVIKRNGCIFDLSYAAPPDRQSAGQADFQRFVDGFVDLRRRK